jgi:hypothetical protein
MSKYFSLNFKTKNVEITQTGKYSYKLSIQGNDKTNMLYSSILKTDILTNSFYNSTDKSLYFTAETVTTLKDFKKDLFLSEAKCIRMIDTLTRQIKYLEKVRYAFYGHNIDDILVVNGDIFININPNTLLPIKDNQISFLTPFIKTQFMSTEINNITTLPSKIHYQSSYYSLAALVIYCLLNKELQTKVETKEVEDLEHLLKPIFYTKIYWFLKRCLHKRILLLI